MDNEAHENDRRRYHRVKCVVPLQYRNLKKMGDPSIGVASHNISEGGVCFKSNQFISLACRLVLEITLPQASKPIKAISKIAWIRKLPVSDRYELGNQFLEMTKEDKTHICNFIGDTLKINR